MSELNLSLWLAGGLIILVVVVYNFWQEYKAKKNVEKTFGARQDDVLMNTESESAKVESKPSSRMEPTLDQAASTESVSAVLDDIASTPVQAERDLPVDELIDCMIPMEFDQPVRGEKLLSEIQPIRIVGNKAVHFIGVTSDGRKEIVLHDGNYAQLVTGVQLVNRGGAINELEYSELLMKLRPIADNLNAFLDIPDMKHVVETARELAEFAAEHDAQLSVNVVAKGAPWDISTLMQALEKQGFDARPDGRLAMLDGEGGALFTLSLNGSLADQVTSRITLLLDVPCVSPERGGFKAMVSCAKSLALRLGGLLVDDSNTPLSDSTLAQIQEQVDAFYSAMRTAEIPAGSSRAIRIFS